MEVAKVDLVQRPCLYPAQKSALLTAIESWAKRASVPKPSTRELARKIGIRHPSLNDWIAGVTKPQTKKIAKLARFLFDDPKEREDFETQMLKVGKAHAGIALDPTDMILEGRKCVTVGVVRFMQFCSANDVKSDRDGFCQPGGFFGELMSAFLRYAGLAIKPPEFRLVEVNEMEKRLCDTNELDLVISLFCLPSRCNRMWFYRQIPILIPLNAVCLRKPDSSDQELLTQLTTPDCADLADKVYPIVDSRESGGDYVANFLGVRKPEDILNVPYNYSTYADVLLNQSLDETERKCPILIIDEPGCLEVLEKVNRQIRNRSTTSRTYDPRVHSTRKEMDLQPRLLAGTNETKYSGTALFPKWRVTFATARNNEQWINFIRETLDIFVESNVELVAQLYFRLYNNLKQNQVPDERIRDWLGIPPKSTDQNLINVQHNLNNIWGPVVARTTALINQQTSGQTPGK